MIKDPEKRKEYYRKYRAKQRQHKDSIYNKYIYCIDIETSTYTGLNSKGKLVPVSFIISFASSKINIETGELVHDIFGRTYSDLDDYLYKLKQESGDKKTIIYIHFFGYEFSFFKDNLTFFRKETDKQLFVQPHKPLNINCGNMSFRCSNLLLGKGVKKLGEELSKRLNEDWHKLDFDYKKVRTPLSRISDKEKAYNFRDCDIVVKYIYEVLLKKYSIKELYDNLLTKTGLTRFDNKKNNTRKDYLSWIVFNNICRPPTEKQYRMEEKAFMGGFVSSNPNYCGVHVKNAASSDEVSAYPAMMYLLKFPYYFRERDDLKSIQNFNNFCELEMFNIKKFFYGHIAIENVRLKEDINYPIWSKHKTYNNLDVVDINGKIISAAYLELVCTSLDWVNFTKFYKFDIVKIFDIYVNRYTRYLPDYVRNNLDRLLVSKTELKPYNNKIEEAAEINNYDFPEEFKWLEKMINEADSLNTQKVLMADYYQDEKSNLNAQYGINVTKPLKENIIYDYEKKRFRAEAPDYEKFLRKKSTKTNMIVGTFVTAFARARLIGLLYKMLEAGITVYYTDTDSIKYDYNDKEKADAIIKAYNDAWIPHKYNIGCFEFEHEYMDFCTNGNKSYIARFINKEGKDTIKATISGMPMASKIYNALYEECCDRDFQTLIEKAFSFNITVMPSVTGKLTSVYAEMLDALNDDEDIEFPDPNLIHVKIGKYEDFVYTGLILKEVPMSIKGLELSRDQLKNAFNLVRYFNIDYRKMINKHTIDLNKSGQICIKTEKISPYIIKKLEEVAHGQNSEKLHKAVGS